MILNQTHTMENTFNNKSFMNYNLNDYKKKIIAYHKVYSFTNVYTTLNLSINWLTNNFNPTKKCNILHISLKITYFRAFNTSDSKLYFNKNFSFTHKIWLLVLNLGIKLTSKF